MTSAGDMEAPRAASETEGNVILMVSNQCFDINPVDIKITIDDRVVVHEKFDVQGGGLAQHNWQRFSLTLPPGEHDLLAKSQPGKAHLETSFTVDQKLTITLAFWCDARPGRSSRGPYFTCDTSASPVGMM